VTSATTLAPGQAFAVTFADGEVAAIVDPGDKPARGRLKPSKRGGNPDQGVLI
jgi:hypothetical protein